MVKPKAKRRQIKKAQQVEAHHDAWERFDAAVSKVAPTKRPKPKASKKG